MTIAFLTPEFPNSKTRTSGGIGTSLFNLTAALHHAGEQVIVMIYGQTVDAVFIENGIEIHLIRNRKFKYAAWYRNRKFLQHYINNEIASKKIDLVEAADWTGITAFMKLKAPLVIRFHGSDAYFCKLENRKQKFKNFLFEKLAVSNATAFIAPTDYAGKVSAAIFKITKRVQTIHYGLALENFTNDNPAQFERGLILHIGTIIRKKGVLELPEIFKKVAAVYPDARLVVIGPDAGDLQTQSESTWQLMAAKLDDSIKDKVAYLGKIPYEQVRDYIKKAHVCVFPTFAETMGMVTIESMAMSKAVVNSNIGWSQELIEDGISGFLVHPENHTLFSDRILTILNDDAFTLEMGRAARIRAQEQFDILKTVRQNIDFYQSVVNL